MILKNIRPEEIEAKFAASLLKTEVRKICALVL